ncbi:MAG: hypothetical protein ABFD69_09545 [Candidatus Sumerlaeia bacterium]
MAKLLRENSCKSTTRGLPACRLFLFVALACLAPLPGCQRWAGKTAALEAQATLAIQLDKTAYRPGEPVKISAVLTNAGGKTSKLRKLDAQSVAFFYCREGDPEPMERRAVFGRREPLGEMSALAAGAALNETFLLTRLTYYSGPMTVVAIYDPNRADARVGGGRLAPKINSNVVKFQVAGEPMFAREPNSGLITSDEARRLAAEKARESGRQGAQAVDIVSVQDENGYDLWWVNVKSPNAGGIDELTGWAVSPYTGSVRQAPKPRTAIDKRLIRKSAPKSIAPRAPAPVK